MAAITHQNFIKKLWWKELSIIEKILQSHSQFCLIWSFIITPALLDGNFCSRKGKEDERVLYSGCLFQPSTTPPRATVPHRLIVANAAKCGESFCTNIFEFPLLHVFAMIRNHYSCQQYYFSKLSQSWHLLNVSFSSFASNIGSDL